MARIISERTSTTYDKRADSLSNTLGGRKHQFNATLRDRIATMEAKGQRGVSMTKKLLANTEKKIAAIEKQYA